MTGRLPIGSSTRRLRRLRPLQIRWPVLGNGSIAREVELVDLLIDPSDAGVLDNVLDPVVT
jgi:hypothetical protein